MSDSSNSALLGAILGMANTYNQIRGRDSKLEKESLRLIRDTYELIRLDNVPFTGLHYDEKGNICLNEKNVTYDRPFIIDEREK